MLFTDEVDAVCAAADFPVDGGCGAALTTWLRRFASFGTAKHAVAAELLQHTDASDPSTAAASGCSPRERPCWQPPRAPARGRTDVTIAQALDLSGPCLR